MVFFADCLKTSLSSCIYNSCVETKIRSECSSLSFTLHYIYTDTLMKLFMFVWYKHCDSMYFIQIASLLFTRSVCPLNKQCCLTTRGIFKRICLLQIEYCLVCRCICISNTPSWGSFWSMVCVWRLHILRGHHRVL